MHDLTAAPLPWLVVGAQVAVITGRPGSHIATTTTIVRITKRDIVLENGERFQHRHQTLPDEDFGHGLGKYSRLVRGAQAGLPSRWALLRSIDDPNVHRISIEAKRAAAKFQVFKAMDAWQREQTTEVTAQLRTALSVWEGLN